MDYDKTIFSNGLETVAFDGGNDRRKAFSVDRLEGCVDLSAITPISPMQWEQAKRRYVGTPHEHAFLGWKAPKSKGVTYYATGAISMNYNPEIVKTRPTGRAKLRRDWYGLNMVGALLQLYNGAIPEYLNIFGAYPPLDSDLMIPLYQACAGKWRIETLSGLKSFEVVTFNAADEIEGGVFNFRQNGNGFTKGKILSGITGQTLVFDLGGGTVDTVLLDENLLPIAGTYDSQRIGVNEVVLQFKENFDNEFHHLMPDSSDGIPLSAVYEIFMHPKKQLVNWAGDQPLDCAAIFEESTTGTINQLYAATQRMVGNIDMKARNVLITGGAGDLLYDEIGKYIFPKFLDGGRIYLADKRGEVIFANVRGLANRVKAIMKLERQKSKKVF